MDEMPTKEKSFKYTTYKSFWPNYSTPSSEWFAIYFFYSFVERVNEWIGWLAGWLAGKLTCSMVTLVRDKRRDINGMDKATLTLNIDGGNRCIVYHIVLQFGWSHNDLLGSIDFIESNSHPDTSNRCAVPVCAPDDDDHHDDSANWLLLF